VAQAAQGVSTGRHRGRETSCAPQARLLLLLLTTLPLCLQAACEANHADKARLQWLEQELEVQAQKAARAEAALQDRAALEDRIQLLQVRSQMSHA
jgi:hypothetical protein